MDIDSRLDRLQTELAALRAHYPQLGSFDAAPLKDSGEALKASELAMLRARYADLDWSSVERPSTSAAPKSASVATHTASASQGASRSAPSGSTRPQSARRRAAVECSGGRPSRQPSNGGAVCHHSKALRPQSAASSPSIQPFLLESRPPSCGGWCPARGHPRRAPGAHPQGYRTLSVHGSSPAYTIRNKLVLSRESDPLVPDDTPVRCAPPSRHDAHDACA